MATILPARRQENFDQSFQGPRRCSSFNPIVKVSVSTRKLIPDLVRFTADFHPFPTFGVTSSIQGTHLMRNRIFTMKQNTPAVSAPEAFVALPFAALPPMTPEQAAYQAAVYQMAMEQAKAVVRPSILERDLLAVWN
jgi:hypothetical protein